MSIKPETMEKLKFAGGALIVGAAVLIMFPGFLSFFFSIGRMLLLIGGALILCLALVLGFNQFNKMRRREPEVRAEQSEASPEVTQ